MYWVLHKLFGWDYVYWNKCGIAHGVARVFVAKDGKVCYWRYRSTALLDEVLRPGDVKWLTCSPEKYFKKEGEDE